MPGSELTLACDDAECVVSLHGTRLASMLLGRNPTLCPAPTKQSEDPIPSACGSYYKRGSLSFSRDLDAAGMRAEIVVDTFDNTGKPGEISDRPFKPKAYCVPRYREKRGDVWQRTWSGASRAFAFQVFEEDDAMPGHGNRSRDTPPKPLVSVESGTIVPPLTPQGAKFPRANSVEALAQSLAMPRQAYVPAPVATTRPVAAAPADLAPVTVKRF